MLTGMVGRFTATRRGFVAGIGGALLAACERPSTLPSQDTLLKPPVTYVALGASDAAGVGVDDPQRDGWVPALSRRLPQPTKLVNLGIPGMKLREAIEVQLPPALETNAHLLTVWLVVNDVLGGVPLAQYKADLDRLLATLQDALPKAAVAVGNVPDAGESSRYLGMPAARRQALTTEWNDAIASVVQDRGAILVDLFQRWPIAQHPEYIGPDGLHPTVAGYRTLADTFLTVLKEQKVV